MERKTEIAKNENGETIGQVALPFNEQQFKDFIVSLLGKPQIITKRYLGSFEILKENIVSLFEVLNQRISQQNDSRLIQFRATIYYDDNSTVTLNGFEHLVHYNESLPVVSKGLHLTWQYLIKFRDKETFEKQEINVSFITEMDGRMIIDGDNDYYTRDNQVYIRIQHTARTWGADIEGVLSKYIKNLVKRNSKVFNFFQYNPSRVENGLSAMLAIITLGFVVYHTYSEIKITNLNGDPVSWVHHYGNLLFLLIGIYILLKVTLILMENFEIYNKPSFILLTPESFKAKERSQKSFKSQWRKYIWTIVSSLILAILGNYLYSLLT